MDVSLITTWIVTGIGLLGMWGHLTNKVERIDAEKNSLKEQISRMDNDNKIEIKRIYEELHFHNAQNEKSFSKVEDKMELISSQLERLIGYSDAMKGISDSLKNISSFVDITDNNKTQRKARK